MKKKLILLMSLYFAPALSASASEATQGFAPTPAPFKAFLSLRGNSMIAADGEKSAHGFADKPGQACVESLEIRFDRPINTASLLGKVYGINQYNSRRPYQMVDHAADFRSFTFKMTAAAACAPLAQIKAIVVADTVASLDGKQLSHAVELTPQGTSGRRMSLRAAAGGELSASAREGIMADASRELDSFSTRGAQVQLGAQPQHVAWRQTATSAARLSVGAADLNRAFAAVKTWERSEAGKSWYRNELSLLALEGTILSAYTPLQRRNHFASPDLNYILRRAAVFVGALYPQLKKIPVADLSDEQGHTPSTQLGQEKIYMHPEGSHMAGKDADVSYITYGNGHEAKGAYDFEKNFWFLYSVLQSSGVDLVMTAFKGEMLAIGEKAMRSGLITDIALGRFNMLMNDQNLNHDKHVHISVRNADNGYRSIRGKPQDNVYNCYLALKPGRRGGNLNFCLQ